MPKKVVRNAYYYFMLEFREEERKKGVMYENLKEVQVAADPIWRNMGTSQRAKFEDMAKRAKSKMNAPDQKFTNYGVPISEIVRQQKMAKEAEDAELQDIKNFLKYKKHNKEILDEDIYLIDVNSYCFCKIHYLFGEVTVLRFSLNEGIKDHYHELINPGHIPLGYASDAKYGSEDLGLEMPDEDLPHANFTYILTNIIDYLRQGQSSNAHTLPPLYTMPGKVPEVLDFISQLCNRAGEDETIFRVYRLDTLFFYMMNEFKKNEHEGFPKLSFATELLRKDLFKYTPGIGCEHHEAGTKPFECSTSRVKRWAFTVLDASCPLADIAAQPGKHLPASVDVDYVVETFKTRKEPGAPSETDAYEVASVSSFGNYSNATSRNKREHVPLRLPKALVGTVPGQAPPIMNIAPGLTESEFPSLTAGVGRGRGLARGFKKLDLN